jgi:hypothetical protein
MNALKTASVSILLSAFVFFPALAQNRPRSAADSVRGHFASINRRILEMVKDFP